MNKYVLSLIMLIVVACQAKAEGHAVVNSNNTIKKRAVIEEFTGTWCPWCPRGMVGMEMVNKEFGDDVIIIAVHGGDDDEPMQLPEYECYWSGGYPSCRINRGEIIDPYYGSSYVSSREEPFGIKSDIEAVLAEYTPAGIDVKAEWADDEQTILNITTTTIFVEDISNQPYQIGYVLLEDGLTGYGLEWIQNNMYVGSVQNDPNLLPLTEMPAVSFVNFDHVSVAAWDTYNGVWGTIPENVVAGEEYTYTFNADITGNVHIQDKGHLTVVALLLDKETGEIVNGAKVRVHPSSPIRKAYSVVTGNTLTFYYDDNMEQMHGSPFYGIVNLYYHGSDNQYCGGFILEEYIRSEITHVVIDSSCENYSPISFSGLFKDFNNLETIEGLRYLNTKNVKYMAYMFSGCSNLTSLDVSKFNTSNVTTMMAMFSGCSGLTSLDVSSFNTSIVTDMGCMFDGCSGLTSLDVSKFNTSNVTDMGSMFDGCSGLTSLDVSKFNTSNVTDMESMFDGCSGLTSLDVSKFNTSNVTNMYYMFRGCSGLTSLDVSKFNTSNVMRIYYMFEGCSGLTSLDVSNFDTSNVIAMGGMFSGCSGLTSLDVSHFDTSNVVGMGYMFSGCSGLTSLDVSKFNTSNVTDIYCMFYGCSSLTSLDVSNFNTSNVTNMYRMFYGCSSLTSLDVSHFNTSNVTYMGDVFSGCSGLTSLDVSNFDTSNVTSMYCMFYKCSGLTSLDLSKFNTSNVSNMSWMFGSCSSLKTIFAGDAWSTDKIEESKSMFSGCSKLVGGRGTKYIDYYVSDHTYARIDGGESAPGYFTVPGLKGDANGDGTVNEADVAEIENYILGRPSDKFKESAADMNYDGFINAADIVEIVKIIKANK